MLQVKKSTRYKKSFKKYQHNKAVLVELKQVVTHLKNREPLPKKYKDHVLKGSLKGMRECHLKPDALLLYFTIEDEILQLFDIGSHSKLLGM